nr:MAG TPA: hypothetical protein [Caudoviricetes sp.]
MFISIYIIYIIYMLFSCMERKKRKIFFACFLLSVWVYYCYLCVFVHCVYYCLLCVFYFCYLVFCFKL